MGIEQVRNHRFANGLFPLAVLGIWLSDIVDRFTFVPESWWEDGLGPASGGCVRLGSGHVILLQELEYLVRGKNRPLLNIEVDGEDLVSVGVTTLLEQVLTDLALPNSSVVWSANHETEETAARLLEARKSRPPRGD